MPATNAFPVLFVLAGAVLILASFAPARSVWKLVPEENRRNWFIIVCFAYFFFPGYILFCVSLFTKLPFPVESVAAVVLFGGAVYVLVIMNLSRSTIRKMRSTEEELRLVNESLEQRVADQKEDIQRSNDELRAERDRTRHYLDAADVIFMAVDVEQKITMINAKGCEILGYSQDEILGANLFEKFIPAGKQEEIKTYFQNLMNVNIGETQQYFEHHVVTKTGEERLIGWHNSVLVDDAGKVIGTLSAGTDITARKMAEESLKSSEERYNKLFFHSNDMIFLHNLEGDILDVNRKAMEMLDYERFELLSLKIFDLHPPEAHPSARETLREVSKNGFAKFETLFLRKDGTVFPAEVSANLLEISGKTVVQGLARDISERKRAEKEIRFLAYYDSLTGLPNRTFYKELLNNALKYAKRNSKTMAVIFMDLDGFKRINDTFGHTSGDKLLKLVGGRIVQTLRQSDNIARSGENEDSDIISRVGGDEFIVLLKDVARPEDAAAVAARLLRKIAEPYELDGETIFMTASLGISLYPSDGEDGEVLLKNADIAMYDVKDHGKNDYKFYSPSMNKYALERISLENELRRALEQEELVLYYQTKVDVRTRKTVGVEALVRWNHPERGLVPPGDFIPLAEESGLIVPLGEWVLHQACAQVMTWQKKGYGSVRVAVNLSTRQFRQKGIVEMVKGILGHYEMDPHLLELEITETSLMEDPEAATGIIKAWRVMGISVSIDDFGKGYSSLDYLKNLPVNVLKIDRAFIMNINSNAQDEAITEAIIAMAHSLRLKVVAEGVETEEQLAFLRELKCDEAQGYLFSRPLPPEEVADLIAG